MKALDLFCCEGGMSKGLSDAGFEMYGLDLFKHKNAKGNTVGFSQKRYPYPSLQMDAIFALDELLSGGTLPFSTKVGTVKHLGLRDFDLLHASPPCQPDTSALRAERSLGIFRPSLIDATRERLLLSGLPYLIENVEGAAWRLRDPILLCGTMFGLHATDTDGTPLEMWRHRLFESNLPLKAPSSGCLHGWHSEQVAGSYGGARRDKVEARDVRHGGYVPAKEVQQALLGIDWMTEAGMYQSIPPLYAEFVGAQLRYQIGVRQRGQFAA